MSDIRDFTGKNRKFTGTTGIKLPTGTTAQRGSVTGEMRFNTQTGLAEYYNGSNYVNIEGTPVVSSISPSSIQTTSNPLPQNITITGVNFQSGATVTFRDSASVEVNSTTVTFNSGTSLTAAVPSSIDLAQGPYDVIVTNPTGLIATLTDALQLDASPSWNTASGTIATIFDNDTGTHTTVSATDPDGGAVTYSETGGTVLSTNNLTLNSSTGAISGDPTDVVSDTTLSFTLRATDNEGSTTDRAFNIVVKPVPNGSSAGTAFTSLSQAATYISNNSSPSGVYYMNVGTGTSYGQSQIQFYFNNAGADGVYVGIPLGTSSLSSIGGSFLPSTLTNYKTIGQNVTPGSSGGTQGNFNGSNQFSTTSSTNASGNNIVDNYANFDLGTEFNYRYFYGTSLSATGSGANTTDWSDAYDTSATQYTNDAPTDEDFFLETDSINNSYSDSCWIGLNTSSTTGILTRPSAWSSSLGGSSGNTTYSGSIASVSSPKDLGASAIGRYFGIHVWGGIGEHYVINSGAMYFKA